ncbi:hypothetical protein [Lutibacter flavus]|uniref:Uncharacterized protein n=1 Tax=Lutibacter flavus TaxID=691689 RepID=A0A238XQP5_9FLAO|nr:hypothetical protein [Lutibacter flavus]SNR61356.1 hypothetical protein SAMN04488111_2035 [Lutibacter flavus]
MKIKIPIFIIALTLFFINKTLSQNTKSCTIENVSSEVVWDAVFDAFKELKLPRPLIATQQGTGETNYYNYKSLMIKNRLRFRINYRENKLIISIFKRQYYTKSGWTDNPLPMSKKQVKKILDPLKERITRLTKNKTVTNINNNTLTNQGSKKLKKAGIYESFAIVRTGDKDMDILAIHENGTIVGYDLSDDKKNVKSLVFKEKEDSEAIIMFFDEQGFPKGMVTDHIIVNLSSIGENMAELAVLDLQGNKIGKNKIELPVNRQADIKFQEDKNSHGPSSSSVFMLNNEDYLSMYIGTSSTLTKAVACGTGIAGGMAAEAVTIGAATPLVIVGVIAACESIYFDLVARYVGEDHFMFKELNLASDISSIISVINPLDMNKWINILSISNDAIPSLKNAVEGGTRLFNKYSPKPIDFITSKNDFQKEVIIAKSDAADKLAIISLVHEASEKISIIEEKIKGLHKVANETNYQKIAIDIQKLEKNIELIKIEYTEKIKKIAQKRTIRYTIEKTDSEGPYYSVSGAEIMGFKWGEYGGPSVEMEVFFIPKRTILKVKQFSRKLRFYQDLKQFSFSFEDGSDNPLKYALLINDKIRQEGAVKTILRIKDFEKDVKKLNFYRSNAKTTKISK